MSRIKIWDGASEVAQALCDYSLTLRARYAGSKVEFESVDPSTLDATRYALTMLVVSNAVARGVTVGVTPDLDEVVAVTQHSKSASSGPAPADADIYRGEIFLVHPTTNNVTHTWQFNVQVTASAGAKTLPLTIKITKSGGGQDD